MRCLLVLFLLLDYCFSFGKKDSIPFIFNEFNVSLNRTNLANSNTADRYGFGLSVARVGMTEKRFNFVFGFEYNLTRQYKKLMYEGHFASSTDIEYTINHLSVPFACRYNIGNKTRFFLEAGIFMDLLINSKSSGTMHTSLPDQNNNIVYKEFTFKEKSGLAPFNYGPSAGAGLRLPFKNRELILKADFRYGLRNLHSGSMDGIYNRYIRVSFGLII